MPRTSWGLIGETEMAYKFNDGGRKDAGYKGVSRDCGVRAMAIAMSLDYTAVYKELAQANKDYGRSKSARNGLAKELYSSVLKKHGWVWVSAPKFIGRKARCKDLQGTVIAHQAHHFVAVVDGVPNDIFDSSDRMVYGYWAKA